jgi:serine/threonine-protein kinase
LTYLLERLRQSLPDRYRVEAEIGRGGMATVFVAEDLKHHRKVAIKVLHPELATYIGTDRFLREIEILAALSHPHILPLHDSGDAGGLLYFVMPLVEGESLRDRLNRDGVFPVAEAVQIVREVASGLAYAHGRGVIHRDIKPQNIMLSGGVAILADFGIAKEVQASDEEARTATGLTLGTPVYMSPEQADGSRKVDGRADIYSLATVLYEMLAGEPPFIEPTAQSVLRRKSLETVPSLRAGPHRVPRGVDEAVSRALARDPKDRFQSVAEFSHALEAGVASAPLSRGVLVAVAVLVLVVGLGVTVGRDLLFGPADTDPISLVVAVPEVGDGDPILGDVVRLGLERALIESTHAMPAGPRETDLALEAMGLTPDAPLNERTALEVAERTGAAGAVLSSLNRVGSGFVLSASVATPVGDLMAVVQRAVASEDALVFALDTLSRDLRSELGDGRRELRESPSLVYVLTPSLEALRLFAEARRDVWDTSRAMQLTEQALAIDPSFAWALAYLSMFRQNTFGDYLAPTERLWDLKDRLTPHQRGLAELSRLELGERDFVESVRFATQQIENPTPDARMDPDFPQFYHIEMNLARLDLGDLDGALAGHFEWRRLVAEEGAHDPDPYATALNLAMTYARLGDTASARLEREVFAELTGYSTLPVEAFVPAAAADWGQAAGIMARSADLATESWWKNLDAPMLGTIEAVRGRPESSRAAFARAVESLDSAPTASLHVQRADAEFFALADPQRASAALEAILSSAPPDSGFARRGHARAQAVAAAICAHVAEPPVEGPAARLDCAAPIATDSLRDEIETLEALGWRAVAEGRLEDAVRIGREPILSRAGGPGLRARAPAAFAYEALGMADSARAIYEPMARAPFGWISHAPSAIAMRSYALRRLARMGKAAGDSASARLDRDWVEAEPAFLDRMSGVIAPGN